MLTKTTGLSEKKELRRLTSRDLFLIKTIEDPQISPDGEEILFTLKNFNSEKNEYESHLEIIPWQEQAIKSQAFTQGPHDGFPRFSPDGKKIAFLRKAGDHAQLFVIPRNGGEARQLTHYKNTVSEIAWSPDGEWIAFSSFVPDKGLVPEDEKPEEDPYKKFNSDVKVISRIWYKLDGKGFLHDKRSQIFLVDVETGKARQITSGDHDASFPRFSPDGKSIVFSSNRNPDSDHELFSHIHLVPVEGGEPRNLTPGEYAFSNPSFSPDGKWIAFIGTDEPTNWYGSPRVWIIPSHGGKPECLTKNPDRPVCDQSINDLRHWEPGEAPLWSKDGQKIYISISDSGTSYLVSVDVKNKTMKEYAKGEHVVFGWDISPETGHAIVGVSSATNPNDLWSLDISSAKLNKITNVNDSFLDTFFISTPDHLSVKSPDGTPVEGWILKPADFAEGKKYPAVLEIHGGPMAMYAWSFFFEFQLLAAHGFVIAYSNPRGSMGYGQPFCEAIKGDWGNLDYQDVMAFLDGVLKKGFVDEKRLGVAGGSYGGFMTNWIVGHTDRFKAAATMRSVTSEYSMFGTSDCGFFGELNLGCLPWERPDAYLKMSPLTYVDKIKTPLLIEHSEDDLRCPIEEAEQLYASLKKLKRDVLFVRFPGESHDLSRTGKPWHRIFRLDQIVSWFEKYL